MRKVHKFKPAKDPRRFVSFRLEASLLRVLGGLAADLHTTRSDVLRILIRGAATAKRLEGAGLFDDLVASMEEPIRRAVERAIQARSPGLVDLAQRGKKGA